MLWIFDLMLALYPPDFRAEFGGEMRQVFAARASGHAVRELAGLVRGALEQRAKHIEQGVAPFERPALSMLCGAVIALGLQLAVYRALIPHWSKALQTAIQHLAARVFLLCVLAGIGLAQQPKQDAATLALAKSIYSRAFAATRNAKTIDDMRKVSAALDSKDWISVDRFGRTVLTGRDKDRDLVSMLNLPPARRVPGMDIIWAEQDGDRLMVLAWTAPGEAKSDDGHRVARGTLVRDIFVKQADHWMRIRHDKLVPNGTVLAVDGVSRILPPLDADHRIVAPTE